MMLLVIDDAELSWSHTMDGLLAPDDGLTCILLHQPALVELWRVANLEGDGCL